MQTFQLRNAAWGMAGHTAERGAAMLTTMMLARALAPEGFAAFGFFQLTMTTLASLSALGVGAAASRLFAQWAGGSPDAGQWIAPLWAACVFAGLIVSLLAVATASWWQPLGQSFPAGLQLLGVVATVTGLVAHSGLLGMGLFKQAAAIAVGVGLCTLLAGSYASLQQSAWLAQAGLVVSACLSTALASAAVLRRFGLNELRTSPKLSLKGVAALGGVVGPLAMVTVMAASSNWLLGRILLAEPLSQASEFAAFAIGLQWYALVQLVPSMVTKAAFPAMVAAYGQETEALRQSRRAVLGRSLRWSLGSSACVAAAVSAASPWLVNIYQGQAGDASVVIWFAFAGATTAAANTVGNALVAVGLSKAWLQWTAIWFVALLTLAWTLQGLGAVGVALSLLVSGVLLTGGGLLTAWRKKLV
jgi:O-antigen/teichoic acid export membrane protein